MHGAWLDTVSAADTPKALRAFFTAASQPGRGRSGAYTSQDSLRGLDIMMYEDQHLLVLKTSRLTQETPHPHMKPRRPQIPINPKSTQVPGRRAQSWHPAAPSPNVGKAVSGFSHRVRGFGCRIEGLECKVQSEKGLCWGAA